jgi:hypothetical protein
LWRHGLPNHSLGADKLAGARMNGPSVAARRGERALTYGATAPKAFGAGGKGIRTPDFQLAKLALYQLSYAPAEDS